MEIDHSSIGAAGDAFVGMGKAFIAGGAILSGGFIAATKAAMDFEHRMSAVQAVSNATLTEMEKLRKVALDLGATTVFSSVEVAEAMEQLAKAGLPVEDILTGATDATVALAAAAGDELAGGIDSAAMVMANAVKTFGGSSDEMMHYADVLVAAAAASTLSVDDIAVSMKYAGPVAAALGFDIDTLATSMAILGDRGIRGSTAGTSLRGVLLSLSPTSEKARGALEELGIIAQDGTNAFYNLDGTLKDLPDVMQILQDATRDLTEEQKVQYFNSIFQRRAMASALILAEQGADGFHAYADAIGELNASDIAAAKLDNLSGDMTILKNSIGALLIEVGLPLQDMLREWAQRATDLVGRLRDLDSEMLAQVIAGAAVVGAILTVVGSFLVAVGVAARLYRNFVLLKTAIATMNAVLLANPIVLIIAAIVALAAALVYAYQNSETFREIVQRGFALVQQAASAVVSWFKSNVIPVFQVLAGVARQVGDFLVAGFNSFVDWAGKHLYPVFQSIQRLFQATYDRIRSIMRGLQPVFNTIGNIIETTLSSIVNLISVFVGVVQTAWDLFGDNILSAVRVVWEFIRESVENALLVIRGIIDTVTALISGDWGAVWDGIFLIFKGIWQQIGNIADTALNLLWVGIQNVIDTIILIWREAWNVVKAIFSTAWDAIKGIYKLQWDIFMAAFGGGLDILKSLWDAAWRTVGNVLGSAWDGMKSVFGGSLDFVVGLFSGLKDRVVGALSSLAGALRDVASKAFNFIGGMGAGFADGFQGVWDWHTKLPDRILTALGNLKNILLDAGKEIMAGLLEGLRSGWTSVKNWMGDRANDLKNLVTAPLRIFSPSRVFRDIGEDIMAGLYIGIRDGFSDVEKLTSTIAPTMNSTVTGALMTATAPGAGGNTTINEYHFDVTLDASDLEEIKDIQDFFDRLEQAARQGVS